MTDVVDQKHILEAAIFAAGEPLPLERLAQLFPESDRPSSKELKGLLKEVAAAYEERGVELVQVASGYRFQAKQELAPWLQRLWEKKPPRYTRAFLETLVLIAYRQPITRGEIEDVRGVAVNSNITKQLLEREWIKIVGHKDVPGKPALFGTTKNFLDYFGLKALSELPALQDVVDLDAAAVALGEQLSLPVEEAKTAEKTKEAVEKTDDNILVFQTADPVEVAKARAAEAEAEQKVVEEESAMLAEIDKIIDSVG